MKDYKRYKWFYTSTGTLVIGGKSAVQNDELLNSVIDEGKERIVMHTSMPGSPFCIIISDVNKVKKNDFEECAIFTGCFSRAWKQGKRVADVHAFSSNQLVKVKGMKTGSWKVNGKIGRVIVKMELVLTTQKKVLRAVPEKSVKKKEILLKICPGKIDKEKMLVKLGVEIGDDINKDELMAALPAGGVRVVRGK